MQVYLLLYTLYKMLENLENELFSFYINPQIYLIFSSIPVPQSLVCKLFFPYSVRIK